MLSKIRQFLQGKKTYISAAALALAAGIGWWIGAVDNTNAVALLTAAGGLAGLAAKSTRTAQLILTALEGAKQLEAQRAAGQKIDAKQIAVEVARQIGPQIGIGNVVTFPITTPEVSAAVPFGAQLPNACIYCGALASLVSATGSVCTDPRNNSQPDSVGNRHHVFFVASSGVSAK